MRLEQKYQITTQCHIKSVSILSAGGGGGEAGQESVSEVPNGGARCEREVTGRMGPASVIGIRSVRRVTVYVMPRLVLAIKIRSSEEPGGTRN